MSESEIEFGLKRMENNIDRIENMFLRHIKLVDDFIKAEQELMEFKKKQYGKL